MNTYLRMRTVSDFAKIIQCCDISLNVLRSLAEQQGLCTGVVGKKYGLHTVTYHSLCALKQTH